MDDFEHYLRHTSPYQSYLYAYPHKTAYRPFAAPVDLRTLWTAEPRHALSLYAHIPFCRMRCAYCNLFALAQPQGDVVERYLAQLATEAQVLRDVLGDFRFAQYAIGGGTPSLLSCTQLAQLFAVYRDTLGVDLRATPGSFELSPDTLSPAKLAVLAEHGVARVSIGIQSFVDAEARAMGRVQPAAELDALLRAIQRHAFPVFNIDLIYGIAGQTEASWLASLRQALQYAPQELFLYPLYVRPKTALFRKAGATPQPAASDLRPALYAAGRDFLLSHGYVQDSLRLFRRADATPGPASDYSCQEDGMIGLGVNARSYTRSLHYATEYAVAKPAVAAIIERYLSKTPAQLGQAEFGIALSDDDRRRRYLIKSLLKAQGLDCAHYRSLFGSAAHTDFPELATLQAMGLATHTEGRLRLSAEGLAYSDLLGHWFISAPVRAKMAAYAHQ